MRNIWMIIAALSLIGNIALAAMVINVTRNPIKDVASQQIEAQEEFPYLSKRIFTENQNDILINFIPLRTAIREYVSKQPDPLGIYFEYLPSGTSVGVNDTLEVKLVSLVKIPLVMAVYKQIEEGKIQKDEVLTIREKDLDKKFGNLWKKGAGAKITVMEAVTLTLVESDNTATNVLVSRVDLQEIQGVFDSLDVPTTTDAENILIISPKSYSSILRSLYLSSYLHEKSSNEILDILTQTIFNDKLPAGIPSNVKVAHKIGVFDTKNLPDKTHSDCGIIYIPDRPYLLCIMTRSNEDEAREYMQHLSKMVYGYIVAVKGGN